LSNSGSSKPIDDELNQDLIPMEVSVYQKEQLVGTIVPTYNNDAQVVEVAYHYFQNNAEPFTYYFLYDENGRIASVCQSGDFEEYPYDNQGRLQTIDNHSFSTINLRFLYEDNELPTRVESYEQTGEGDFELRRFSDLSYDQNGNLLQELEKDQQGNLFRTNTYAYDTKKGIFSRLTPFPYFYTLHFSKNNFEEIKRVSTSGFGTIIEHELIYNEIGFPLEIKELVKNISSGEINEDETLRITYQAKIDVLN